MFQEFRATARLVYFVRNERELYLLENKTFHLLVISIMSFLQMGLRFQGKLNDC